MNPYRTQEITRKEPEKIRWINDLEYERLKQRAIERILLSLMWSLMLFCNLSSERYWKGDWVENWILVPCSFSLAGTYIIDGIKLWKKAKLARIEAVTQAVEHIWRI